MARLVSVERNDDHFTGIPDDTRTVGRYLDEMGKIPLLEKKQGRELVKKLVAPEEFITGLKPQGFTLEALFDANERKNGQGPDDTVICYSAIVGNGNKPGVRKIMYEDLKRMVYGYRRNCGNIRDVMEAMEKKEGITLEAAIESYTRVLGKGKKSKSRVVCYTYTNGNGNKLTIRYLTFRELEGMFDTYRRSCRERDEALRILAESNLRLVVNIAKNYQNKGLGFMDLIGEGNIGLIQGLETFDYRMRRAIGTHVGWWIKNRIMKALTQKSRTVRLSTPMVEIHNKIREARRELLQESGGIEPIEEELIKRSGVSRANFHRMYTEPTERVSLDYEGERGGLQTMDIDDEKDDITEDTKRYLLKRTVAKALRGAPKRQKKILELYYGLGKERPHTLEEIGDMMGGLSKERIRQLKERAMPKVLRNLRRAGFKKFEDLAPFFTN